MSQYKVLSDQQVQSFMDNGYLVVKDFLTPEEVDRLNAAFDANRDAALTIDELIRGVTRALQGCSYALDRLGSHG